jgi:hypothetical protein
VDRIMARISARTQSRIAKAAKIAEQPGRWLSETGILDTRVVQDCSQDVRWLEKWLESVESRFGTDLVPRDRPLVLRARGKLYTIWAYLEDQQAEHHLPKMKRVDPTLYAALKGCQGTHALELLTSYLADVESAIRVVSADSTLESALIAVVNDHLQISRTLHSYPCCPELERVRDRRVRQSLDGLLALARAGGRAGIVAQLAERAWVRATGSMMTHQLKASREEVDRILAGDTHLPPSIRDAILSGSFYIPRPPRP